MKKILLGAAAFAMLATVSCKKSDDNSTPSNSWTVGSTNYTSLSTTVVANAIFAASGTSGSSSSLTISFGGSGSTPVAGTYKVVGNSPGANQCSFTAGSYNGSTLKSYVSTGNDNVNATVTINNNKVVVSMPNAYAKASSTDSVLVSANLTQN